MLGSRDLGSGVTASWASGTCPREAGARPPPPSRERSQHFHPLPVNSRAASQLLSFHGYRVGPCEPSREAVTEVGLVRQLSLTSAAVRPGPGDRIPVVAVTPRGVARTRAGPPQASLLTHPSPHPEEGQEPLTGGPRGPMMDIPASPGAPCGGEKEGGGGEGGGQGWEGKSRRGQLAGGEGGAGEGGSREPEDKAGQRIRGKMRDPEERR